MWGNMIGRWERKAEDGSRSLLRSYTIAFAALCLVVFVWYYAFGRTLIWKGDGWSQHYKALLYYAKYLRCILKNFFTGSSLFIPSFDIAIGEGNDILETFHYYVIGDPFALLSFLVPLRLMVVYYVAMILLRMYLAGLAFIWMMRTLHRGKSLGNVALIAGASVYVFAYWGLFNAARHPYFLNPCIYLPLLVIGIEKILRRERPYLFAGMVAVAGVSNFYFFYVLAILTAVYAALRVLWLRRTEGGKVLKPLLRLGAYALWGLALAAFIFLPMSRAFLTNARMGTPNARHLIYPLSYYGKLPALALSSGEAYWVCMGFAAPVFPACCLLWRRKGNGFCKLCMAVCGVMLLFPVFGQALNGFSYMCNRWSFCIALVCGAALTLLWDELTALPAKDWKFLCKCCGVYAALCVVLWNSRTPRAFGSILLLLLTMWELRPVKAARESATADGETEKTAKPRNPGAAVAAVIALAIAVNSFWLNCYLSDSYASKAMYVWDASNVPLRNEAEQLHRLVRETGDSAWFRYSGTDPEKNANVVGEVSSTQFYWTIGSPALAEYRTAMSLREYSLYKYQNYDERAVLTTLSAVGYYVINPTLQAAPPYGFSKIGTLADGRTEIYKNDQALPLFYTYDDCVLRKDWDTLSSPEKEDVLLRAMVVEREPSAETPATSPDALKADGYPQAVPVPFTVECGEGVSFDGRTFTVGARGGKIELLFDGLADAETMFEFLGAQIIPTTGQEPKRFGLKPFKKPITIGPFTFEKPADFRLLATDRLDWKVPDSAVLTLSDDRYSKNLELYNNEYRYYNGRRDFCVNLGYREEAQKRITVSFSEEGTYTFDEIRVWCRPMAQYAETVAKRAGATVRNLTFKTNEIAATVVTDVPKLVCIAVPYHEGFTAYVNGEKAELLHANVGYMGVHIKPGENRVQLLYRPPLRLAGGLISFAALAAGVWFVIYRERQIRQGRRKENSDDRSIRGGGCQF